jgi:hypothetical protein
MLGSMCTWRVRRALAGTVAVLALAALASGCGSASETSPPAGVDGLVIPTPTPDPDDFVTGVDNPWFPLAPGETRMVDGVETTVATTPDHASGDAGRDYYAQDRAGNVWWFGRAGEWEAGVDGAEAGLAMPATPRVGDGFRMAVLDGVVEDVARVESVDGTLDSSVAVQDHLVVLLVSSDLNPGTVQRRFYGRGVGLVFAETLADSDAS